MNLPTSRRRGAVVRTRPSLAQVWGDGLLAVSRPLPFRWDAVERTDRG